MLTPIGRGVDWTRDIQLVLGMIREDKRYEHNCFPHGWIFGPPGWLARCRLHGTYGDLQGAGSDGQ